MLRTCKLCWGTSAALIAVIAALGFAFVVPGSVTASDDGRTSIAISVDERDLVLAEMRRFLESVSEITSAIAQDDMARVAESANRAGMANAGQAPVALMAKLPMEFMTLGRTTHEAFDDLAREATDMGDGQVALTKLGELLDNCTTCHAGYRLDLEGGKGG